MRLPIAALLLALAACSRSAPPRLPLVVLRFDNLTGDPSLDWMGRGAARALAAQIEGAAAADSAQPAEERERALATGSTRVLQGYLSLASGRLRLRAELEDAGSRKFVRSAEADGPLAAGVIPLADSVARALDPHAGPAPTRSGAALEAFVAALNAQTPGALTESLTSATAADPNFAIPYLMLIEIDQARHDRASAERVLAAARARGEAFSATDRVRLDVAAAQISGDSAALSKSLTALARLTPNDPRLLRGLGDAELQARRYTAAAGYYRKALAAQPGDANLLNTLGYAQAYAGDPDGAIRTLREYERARPGDPNALDSLGDVNFFWGRFAEAEQFYQQEFKKDPAFLNGASMLKGAMAHLFTGDPAGAEAAFAEYEAARRQANDPTAALARASWDHLRGKHKEAVSALDTFAVSTRSRELASLAHSTLTVWLLDAGDREGARRHAAQAVASAAGPATGALAAACRYIAGPADTSSPVPLARAYALLLARDFAAATPLLRQIEAHAPPNPSEPSGVLLGWALVETGHAGEAAPYLRTNPVPSVTGPAPFESLLYPRLFHLRAAAAEKQGDAAAAARNNRLFQSLQGAR